MPHEGDERAPAPAMVRLYGTEGIDWRPVSPRLVSVRILAASAFLVPAAAALAVVALLLWVWAWAGVAVVAVAFLVLLWLVPRQVAAMSWAELGDEVVIRRGRLVRTLVAIPYGRLQYVDLTSGPLLRRHGLATLTLNTASPMSSGTIPGMPLAEAEALRERLARRAEAERAGL